ncbi:hypothetical protein [Microvirga sp. KLBC 81]|uniref:hypothetical protein n=1 Tax=Microvirga sp. KLBC 81 TaxID=1862707 RepID=UPI001057CDCA|nr:hypothetical protein [Microvirga sp. KLBC 81]
MTAVTWEARWLQSELERMSGYGYWNKAGEYIGKPWTERPQWPEGPCKDVDDALNTLSYCESRKVEELVKELRGEVLPAMEWALGRTSAMDGEDQDLPPAFVREMDRLGIGATGIETGDSAEEADDHHNDREGGVAVSATSTESIALTAALDASVNPTPGVLHEEVAET